jgi:hypothetical protein
MTQVIIYKNPNGTNVCVCTPAGELDIETVLIKDCPIGAIIVDTESLPQFDEFVDAWYLNDTIVSVDFSKAQEITRTRLRNERIPLLAAQDILFQRALETGADTSAIVAEKNRLRDITNLINTANTLDDLRSLTCNQA